MGYITRLSTEENRLAAVSMTYASMSIGAAFGIPVGSLIETKTLSKIISKCEAHFFIGATMSIIIYLILLIYIQICLNDDLATAPDEENKRNLDSNDALIQANKKFPRTDMVKVGFSSKSFVKIIKRLFRNSQYTFVLLLLVLFSLTFGAFERTFGMFLRYGMGFDEHFTGAVLGILLILVSINLVFLPQLIVNRFGYRKSLTFGFLCAFTSILFYCIIPNKITVFISILFMSMASMVIPMIMSYITKTTQKSNHGFAMGVSIGCEKVMILIGVIMYALLFHVFDMDSHENKEVVADVCKTTKRSFLTIFNLPNVLHWKNSSHKSSFKFPPPYIFMATILFLVFVSSAFSLDNFPNNFEDQTVTSTRQYSYKESEKSVDDINKVILRHFDELDDF